MSDQSQTDPPVFDPSQFTTTGYVRRVEKPWGYELHFAQTDLPYMGKLMHIKAGCRQSLQIHDAKRETFILIKGRGGVQWQDSSGAMVDTEFEQFVGYRTSIGQKHRLYAITDCDVMEASTSEQGTTWRLEDDYDRGNETPAARRQRDEAAVDETTE